MGKRENRLRRTLEKEEKARSRSTDLQRLPSAEITRPQLIIFGFKHLDLRRGKFSVNNGHGENLIKIFQDLIKHSGYDRITLGSRLQFHPVPEINLKRNNLADLITLAERSKVFQMGSKGQAERIVGYFEALTSNVFQVCVLDLDHQICPSN